MQTCHQATDADPKGREAMLSDAACMAHVLLRTAIHAWRSRDGLRGRGAAAGQQARGEWVWHGV